MSFRLKEYYKTKYLDLCKDYHKMKKALVYIALTDLRDEPSLIARDMRRMASETIKGLGEGDENNIA